MLWMYATPIFYPVSILPQEMSFIFDINPLYHLITFLRTCIIHGIAPDPREILICALYSFGMLVIGGLVFKKTQDKFIFYI